MYRRLHCLLLVDPFSGATMTLPAPPRIYAPDEGDDGSEDGNDIALMDALDKYFVMVKLIVCSPCLVAALFRVDTVFKIAVCRPGSSSWSVPQCPFPWNTDIAFYQGKLFAITCTGYLLALNISVDDNTGDPQFAESEEIITPDTSVGAAARVLVLITVSCLTTRNLTLGTSVRAVTMLMVWQTTSRSRICQ